MLRFVWCALLLSSVATLSIRPSYTSDDSQVVAKQLFSSDPAAENIIVEQLLQNVANSLDTTKFCIGACLGHGFQGGVYCVLDWSKQIVAAVKSSHPDCVAELQNEYELLQTLHDCPHIIRSLPHQGMLISKHDTS